MIRDLIRRVRGADIEPAADQPVSDEAMAAAFAADAGAGVTVSHRAAMRLAVDAAAVHIIEDERQRIAEAIRRAGPTVGRDAIRWAEFVKPWERGHD